MDSLCLSSSKVKKDDDVPSRKQGGQKGWANLVLFGTTAAILLVVLFASTQSRRFIDELGNFRGKGNLFQTASCPEPQGVYLHPNRPLAMLDVAKWQLRNISQNVFPDGFPVHHYESSQSNVFELARKQWWESETFRVAATIIPIERKGKPNATVLDIGGWIGITGMYYSTHAPRVIAVEPDVTARSELVANVALNPVLEPRIRVYDKCISHKKGELIMKGDPGGSWSSILFHNDKTLPSWKVECITFEMFLELAQVDPNDVVFIKIDIEGAEHTVLPSMRKWLRRHNYPPIWVSMHKWLWEGDEAKEKMAAAFRDYKHVFNSRLEEIPRANLEDAQTFFGDTSDSVYLLSNKVYKFVDLATTDFIAKGSVVALPDESPKKALRRRRDVEEEEDTTDTDDMFEEEEEVTDTTDTDDGAQDDDTTDVVEEEEEIVEEEPEPEPPRRRRRKHRM